MNENIISIYEVGSSKFIACRSFSKRGNRHTLILASSAIFNSKYLWLT